MPTDLSLPETAKQCSPLDERAVPGCASRFSRAHWAGVFAIGSACLLAWVNPLGAAVPLLGFVALCLAGTQFPRWSFFLPVVCAGSPASNSVTLTFDDGPDPVSTPPLLDLLARHGIKAAFFVIGEKAGRHPDLLRKIVAGGHEIGNHSHHHDVFLMLRSRGTLEREIADCQEVLGRQGVRPLVFRPPVGVTNPNLRALLERLGMLCVCFSCRPADFGNRRVEGLAKRVLDTVKPGDILLLHDCEPNGGVEPWLAEVEGILDGLKRKRIGVLPLSALLGRPVMQVVEQPGLQP